MKWVEVVELHNKASCTFAETAAGVPSETWMKAGEGEWSPAHITKHLSLAYEILLSELNGGAGMDIRTKFWQRTLLRWTMVPRLLRGKPFPKGAKAPRETRPTEITEDQADAVANFRKLAASFEEAALNAYAKDSGTQLTHAYFGRSDLVKSLQFCARHVQHHARTIANWRL